MRKFWTLFQHMELEKLNELKRSGLSHLLHLGKMGDKEFSFDDLASLIKHFEGQSAVFIYPSYITNFIMLYLGENDLKSVLGCWAGSCAIISDIKKIHRTNLVVELIKTAREYELMKIMQSEQQIDWRVGEPYNTLNLIRNHFNVIIGIPPVEYLDVNNPMYIESENNEIRDDYPSILLLKASLLLNDRGCSIFILPYSFLANREEYRVINNLNRFGLCIEAILHLESGALSPLTTVSSLLVIVRRNTQADVFVGKITQDSEQQKALLNNLNARKGSKSLEIGALVKLESFRSLNIFAVNNDVINLGIIMGVPSIRLADICKINILQNSEGAEYVDLQNSIYLPRIPNLHVVTSLQDLTSKQYDYIQLVIDTELAIPEYLVHFFNTSLGNRIRDASNSGILPKIIKSNILEAEVLLPSKDTQIEIIRTQSIITDITTKIDTLKRDLWKHPKNYKKIKKSLNKYQSNDDFIEWLESLPFPISSILWAYKADLNIEHKVDHLFSFYLALAEFLAVFMLSSYAGDKDFYYQESKAWIEENSEHEDWVLKADFGGWRILGTRLAKATRRLLENNEKREICMNLFGNPSEEFLNMITNKKLFNILNDANEYRNKWQGHKGLLSPSNYEEILVLLESKLSEVRNVMQDIWESVLLLYPGKSEYSEGIYEYQVKTLVGTRSHFKEMTVRTVKPMEKNKIYILHLEQRNPVELLPFIRLMESPRTHENAIYFYNRMDGDNIRWVSYYYDKDSDITRSDDSVTTAIKYYFTKPLEG